MNSALYKDFLDFATFLKAIFVCGCMTGLITVPVILIGYEKATKRRI